MPTMANPRIKLSQAQEVALIAQVESQCPLCNSALFYSKGSKTFKSYEIAHIYPLNPLQNEAELLKNEGRLHPDINHENNLIPLCPTCHGKFDKPRTVAEYNELVDLKRKLTKRAAQKALWQTYPIEQQIGQVIQSLLLEDISDYVPSSSFEVIEMDKKLSGPMPAITKNAIKSNVVMYFGFIRQKFADLDALHPQSADLIAAQIKTYYLKQKSLSFSKQEIFQNIVNWINSKARGDDTLPAEIVVSFFVQNCEVFE
jgi:hypothetical protein